MSKHTRYTREELEQMFRDDSSINQEFKTTVLWRLDALYQAMYNCVNADGFSMTDAWGDPWVEEHNRFVQDYQRYHN